MGTQTGIEIPSFYYGSKHFSFGLGYYSPLAAFFWFSRLWSNLSF